MCVPRVCVGFVLLNEYLLTLHLVCTSSSKSLCAQFQLLAKCAAHPCSSLRGTYDVVFTVSNVCIYSHNPIAKVSAR